MTAPERFSPLPDEADVFRLVIEGHKVFMPPGVALPLPAWLEPNDEDVAAATKRNRPPGLSVWDCARTRVSDAARIRWGAEPPAGVRGFAWRAGRVREIGRNANRHVDVVTHPRDAADGAGADGHALIEGLKRPDVVPRPLHRQLLTDLARASRPFP